MAAGWSSGSGGCWNWGQVLAALVACCLLSLGCSPRNTAADAAGVADAAVDGGFDVVGDLADSEVDSATEVQDGQGAGVKDLLDTGGDDGAEVVDAITDWSDGDGDAMDATTPCTSTDIPAALTGTVEFDFSPLVPNKVVTGCGKGPPQPVKAGAPCCKCPPPYSCYCDGECGWLRAPDLVKPQHSGQAVWTGKWVVSFAQSYDQEGYNPFETCGYMAVSDGFHVQRWQPGSGKGFELVPMPNVKLYYGKPVALLWGKKVVIATQRQNCMLGQKTIVTGGYSPAAPVYLYDPESNVFSPLAMPKCYKLVVAGETLVCYQPQALDEPKETAAPGGLQILDSKTLKWSAAASPEAIAPPNWYFGWSDRILGNSSGVYLYDSLRGGPGNWPDGSRVGISTPGHIVKYSIDQQKWSDLGPVIPSNWRDVDSVGIDNHGIVATTIYPFKAARFHLADKKWQFAPEVEYGTYGDQAAYLTPCGLFFGSGSWDGNPGFNFDYRPILLTNDLKWHLPPNFGIPNDSGGPAPNRALANFLVTDKEVLLLGGKNGPPSGFGYHKDGYRYPLSVFCNGGLL